MCFVVCSDGVSVCVLRVYAWVIVCGFVVDIRLSSLRCVFCNYSGWIVGRSQ